MKRWYLVYTKSRKEKVAEENLKRQGYEVYLPLIEQARRRRERRTETIEPLFPRYLFLCFRPGCDNIAPIRYTTGVSGLVRFTEEPAVVPDQIIASLRSRADGKSGLHRPKDPMLAPGDMVTIEEGPLSGVGAIFLAGTGQERVAILVHMLGRQNRVSVERDLVRLA